MRLLLVSQADRGAGGGYGPIVMNTRDELRQAIQELNEGTFIEP